MCVAAHHCHAAASVCLSSPIAQAPCHHELAAIATITHVGALSGSRGNHDIAASAPACSRRPRKNFSIASNRVTAFAHSDTDLSRATT
jgi:hypothetical protein